MARLPAEIRAVSFFDGQNPFHSAKAAFGYPMLAVRLPAEIEKRLNALAKKIGRIEGACARARPN